jgi:hypothetical protein
MNESTSTTTKEIQNLYAGVTDVLERRATQLYNTVYALKQHIFFLRKASETYIAGQKRAATLITIPPRLHLADDGIRSLLTQLSKSSDEIANCMETWNNPQTAFSGAVASLNDSRNEMNDTLRRLQGEQKKVEKTATAAAKEVNDIISNLARACASPMILDPYSDPHTVDRLAYQRLGIFLVRENEYKKRCLTEQNVAKHLEKDVFTTLHGIPIEHGQIMSAVFDECNEILAAVNTKMDFESLTDWVAFESAEGHKFVPEHPEPIVLTADNHPDDVQFSQFEQICEELLEIKHKLPRPPTKGLGE